MSIVPVGTAVRALTRRLFAHCGSDEDIWIALTSGALLDDQDTCLNEEEFAISVWWEPNCPIPTVGSVLREWEEAAVHNLTTDVMDGEEIRDVLETYVSDVSNQCGEVEDAIGRIAASSGKMEEVTLGLHSIFYDRDSFLYM